MTAHVDLHAVEIGGRVAALEDVEGQEIVLGRDEPPEL